MKSCPSAVELERWLAEDRGDAEGGGITAHLEECPRCQEFMEQALRGAGCLTLSARVPGTLEAVGALDVPLMQRLLRARPVGAARASETPRGDTGAGQDAGSSAGPPQPLPRLPG